jgi:hypothetical protein
MSAVTCPLLVVHFVRSCPCPVVVTGLLCPGRRGTGIVDSGLRPAWHPHPAANMLCDLVQALALSGPGAFELKFEEDPTVVSSNSKGPASGGVGRLQLPTNPSCPSSILP